jgi:hypothetical protein
MEDRRMIQSFVKSAQAEKSASGAGGVGAGKFGNGGVSVAGAQQNDAKGFEKLVAFCETNTCRHAAIASFFGETARPVGMPACKSCDHCTNPGAVERQLQMMHNVSSGIGGGRGIGSGRFRIQAGKRVWVDGEEDDETEHDGIMKPRGVSKSGFTLASVLVKRRKATDAANSDADGDEEDEEELGPPPNTRLRDAANTPHRSRPRLDWRVRERVLTLLASTWGEIWGKPGSDSIDNTDQDIPSELEHRLFTKSKTPSEYKAAAKKLVFLMKKTKGNFPVSDHIGPLLATVVRYSFSRILSA